MKFREYLNEELETGIKNRLIQKINMEWGNRKHRELSMMLRKDNKTDMYFVMMVNTFHEFPKEFLKKVKDNVKLSKNEVIDEKNRKIVLSDDNWKKVYNVIK